MGERSEAAPIGGVSSVVVGRQPPVATSQEVGGVWAFRGDGRVVFMTKAEHRELLREFDERVGAGGVPAKVWGSLLSLRVTCSSRDHVGD